MFIVILTYKKQLEEVDRFLQAHRDYLAEHYAAGDFIASGPQTPRVDGVIMIKAENRTTVDAIIAQDPFNIVATIAKGTPPPVIVLLIFITKFAVRL